MSRATSSKSASTRRIGRPPAGAREGERVKDYPQLSLRLPSDIRDKLRALSIVTARPQWRLIAEAIECYLQQRPDAEQQIVGELVRRRPSSAPRRAARPRPSGGK